jgi:hypothetical protein
MPTQQTDLDLNSHLSDWRYRPNGVWTDMPASNVK